MFVESVDNLWGIHDLIRLYCNEHNVYSGYIIVIYTMIKEFTANVNVAEYLMTNDVEDKVWQSRQLCGIAEASVLLGSSAALGIPFLES